MRDSGGRIAGKSLVELGHDTPMAGPRSQDQMGFSVRTG
jgi:hypothetical protein